jgi:hypothetical protein
MKTISAILSFIFGMAFTLVLIVGVVIGTQQQQTDQLKQPQQIVKVEPVKVDTVLVERLEELTRENVRLLQEVADQAKQIQEFGWMKEVAKE